MTDHVTDAVLVASTRSTYDQSEMVKAVFLTRYRMENTRKTYDVALTQWYGWCREMGVEPLRAQRSHIELFARELEMTGRCAATVASKLNVLSVFYKFAVIDEHIDRDPTIAVSRPRVERKSTSTLFTRGEIADMLKVADESGNLQDHVLLAMLTYTGLRIGGILGIDMEHVVEHRGQVGVRVRLKGGNHQTITFAPVLAWVVKPLLAQRGETGPLFQTKTGQRMDRKTAGRIVKRIAKAAGITKRAHCHAFRKSHATIARAAGVPDREIVAELGWANSTMLDYYDGGKETLQANSATQFAAHLDRAS